MVSGRSAYSTGRAACKTVTKMASVSAQKFLSHAAISPSASPYGYRAPSTCWHPPPLAGAEGAEHENYKKNAIAAFYFSREPRGGRPPSSCYADGLGRVGPASTTSRKIATTSRTRARTSSASATRIIACAANYSSAKAEPNKSNKGAANSNNSCLIFITMTSRWVFGYYLRKASKRMSKSILDGGGKQESLQLLFAADKEDVD